MVKKALLVGINYTNTKENELFGCINDILNMNEFLIKYCNYLPENIRILTDKTSILPTKDNIIKNIEWLTSDVNENDTLIFQYSGHGDYIKDKNKKSDESDKRDERIIPIDALKNGEIIDDWLYSNLVLKIPEKTNLWCFFDCCFSGTSLDLMYNCIYKLKNKTNNKTNKENFVYKSEEWSDKFNFSKENSKSIIGNVCEFSGCTDKETSEDATINKIDQGAFTFCLLKFLTNHLIEKDGKKEFPNGKIKLKDVLKEINAYLKVYGFRQNSQLSVGKESDFDRFFNI